MTARKSTGRGIKSWPGSAVCALLALLTGLAAFLPYIIATEGFFTLAEDYNQQQLPFLAAAAEGLRELGSGEWTWNLDLGASLITGFGYYNLGSPFTWLALPFSKAGIPYLAVWLILLKYIVAAETAYFWLKRFVKRNSGAVLGGLLYAFSGFQSTNLLFHFHDAVAFFPLLLLGLDRLTEEKKGLGFILSVALNCLVNYVFFVQEVVFVVLYFLVRHLKRDGFPELLKMGGTALACAAVGVAMAAPLFVPNVIYLLNSPRGNHSPVGGRMLYDLEGSLLILKGLLLPGEAMREQSSITRMHYLSTSAYIPFFGMSFTAVYLAENRGWLKRLLLVLLAVSFSPLLQSGFLLFTETFQRWWYMLNLLCVLATVLAFERMQFQTPRGRRVMGLYTGGAAALCAVIWKAPWAPGGTLVISRELYFLFAGIGLGSCLLCFGLVLLKRLNGRTALLLAMAACVVTTGAVIGVYRRAARFVDYTKPDYQLGLSLETVDEQYRYGETNNLYTAPGAGAGVGSFSSTKENGAYEFLLLFTPDNKYKTALVNTAELPRTVAGLPELLGGKYRITEEMGNKAIQGPLPYPDQEKWIVETEACPIGFASGAYITLEELKKADVDQRAYLMMTAVAVDSPEQVSAYEKLRWEPGTIPKDPKELIRRTVDRRVRDFHRDVRGFTCATDYDQDQLVFFSVPNDAGWTALVDGERAEIIDSCGMMALNVPRGKHRIAFSYHTPGLSEGLVLSAAGGLMFLLLCVRAGRSRLRRKRGAGLTVAEACGRISKGGNL